MSAQMFSDKVSRPSKIRKSKCVRCGGTGAYGPLTIYEGRCMRCQGSGFDPVRKDWTFPTDWTEEQISRFLEAEEAKKEARRVKREAGRRAEMDAQMADNLARFPELAEPFQELAHHIIEDIHFKAWRRDISEAQAALVVKIHTEAINRRADAEAEEALERPVPATEDRIQIRGEVLSTKWQDSQYGGSLKMLVKVTTEDGGFFKLWGSVPSAIDPAKGDTVAFTAKVQRSDDDESFGFFSRPTKAEVL